MSAIALLDVSGADAAFSELVTRARAAAGQWAAEHPAAPPPAMAKAATPPPQVGQPPCRTHDSWVAMQSWLKRLHPGVPATLDCYQGKHVTHLLA